MTIKTLTYKTSDKIWLIINSSLFIMGLVFSKSSISLAFILIIWLNLVLYGVHKSDKLQTALDRKNTISLRGISAIEIMLGHIGLSTGNFILYPNKKAGILFVGIFFMLSGYGLTSSFYSKTNYLKSFFRKRLSNILCPVLIVYISATAIYHVIWPECDIWERIDFYSFLQKTNWYVWELLLLYVLFYICFKLNEKYALLLLTMASLMIILAAYELHLSNPWYGSTMCFPLGILYYYISQGKLKNLFPGRFFFLYFFTLVISTGTFFYGGNTFLANVLGRNIASLSFCIIIILFLDKYRIGNIFTIHLGYYSYEIFLIHPNIISFFRKINLSNDYLFSALVIIVTLVASIILKHFENNLRNIFKKKFLE